MPYKGHTISVLIPVRNGGEKLRALLLSLAEQDLQADEILATDTESTDGSRELLERHGVRVLPVLREEFDHGGTRSMLARQATGDILVYFTQDAVPASKKTLTRLIDGLLQNAGVACAYGRQLPWPEATGFAAHLRLFNYPPVPQLRSHADRYRFGFKTIFLSNSFSAFHRAPLAEAGYFKNGLIFGEDTCTLGMLLAAGHLVAYAADAEVYHSHNYSFSEEFRRSFDTGVLHSRESWLQESYGNASKVGTSYVKDAIAFFRRRQDYWGIADCVWRILVKYLGYLLGKRHKVIPLFVRIRCSLNRGWWQGA